MQKVHAKLLLSLKTRRLNWRAKESPSITVIEVLENIKRSLHRYKNKKQITTKLILLVQEGFIPKVILLILKEIQRL